MKLSVREILRATGGRLVSGDPLGSCGRVSIDSRTLRPGEVFYALHGPHFDGHAFVPAVSQKKAKAIVLERLPQDLRLSRANSPDLIQVPDVLRALQDTGRYVRTTLKETTVIGLTGSNGKTTTKEMLAAILCRAGKTLSTRGNLNNHIGLPLMLSELEPVHRYAVLELGTSKVGDMDLLIELSQPQVGIITNVGKDHLEYFGTPEGVLKENRKLFDALPKDGLAIINRDDPLLQGFAGRLPCRTVTYGLAPESEVSAAEIKPFPAPVRFMLKLGNQHRPVALNVIGKLQVLNAMAAAAVAYGLGIAADEIVAGLESFTPAPMRMDVKRRADDTLIVNDAYNANPSSMRASIDSFLHSYPDRPRWLVLGDMRELGPVARQEHEELGRWLSTRPLERIFLYGRDTRYILQGLQGQLFHGAVERFRKKRYLIDALKRSLGASPKPAVLLKASRRLALEQVGHALLSL